MTVDEVMADLAAHGSAQQKKTFLRHGAKEPFFGVKVGDLKVLQKKIKRDHALALGLYATGNSDAMYLAGLIADPPAMTKADLKRWAKGATWHMQSEYTVPWVAAESRFGRELALEWMTAKAELLAACGWSTYSSLVGITPDDELDLDEIAGLLGRVKKGVHGSANRVKYTMMSFVIAVGGYVVPLGDLAVETAKAVGPVSVDMGDTDCKVPDAVAYIAKIVAMGRQGKKRKTAMC